MTAPFANLIPTIRQHYTGFIVRQLTRATKMLAASELGDAVTIDNHQANGAFGVHQCRVRLNGDATVYRLLLAPADAPIRVQGRAIEDYFCEPLGSEPVPVLERVS